MSSNMPQHVAIIMDGNGRWGEQKFGERVAGHKAGVRRVKEIITYANQISLPVLSLWAFSTDNWKRPRHEVT